MRISDWSSDVCSSDRAQRLRNAGVQRFYLVSHAWHMPRAMLSFEAAGLEPITAPTRFLLPGPLIWRDFLPTVGAMNVTYYRSAARRVGKECVSTCSTRWLTAPSNNNQYGRPRI